MILIPCREASFVPLTCLRVSAIRSAILVPSETNF